MSQEHKSLVAHLTVEQRTRIGYTLYLDAYEKRFKYAREIVNGVADLEIRMAIFWAIHERLVDLNSMDDAAIIFSPVYTDMLKEAKDWSQEHLWKTASAMMPFIDQDLLKSMAALMRQPEKPTIMGYGEYREAQRQEMRRSARRAEQQRTQFNSQHKPAPEGTVKELAAKYGKSISEIRRLKAEGLLHTLAE